MHLGDHLELADIASAHCRRELGPSRRYFERDILPPQYEAVEPVTSTPEMRCALINNQNELYT